MTNPRLTVQNPISTIEWLNQLSDWLGTFFPNGYRFPPRHPLKVSLMMGLLGLASGSLTGISTFIVQTQFYTSFAPTVFAGCLFGLFVVFPLIAWVNLDRSMIFWAAVYTAIIPVAYNCIQMHNIAAVHLISDVFSPLFHLYSFGPFVPTGWNVDSLRDG